MGRNNNKQNRRSTNRNYSSYDNPSWLVSVPDGEPVPVAAAQANKTKPRRDARSPPPQKRLRDNTTTTLSPNQQGKRPEQATSLPLEQEIINDTYGPKNPSAPNPVASQDASNPSSPNKAINDMQIDTPDSNTNQ